MGINNSKPRFESCPFSLFSFLYLVLLFDWGSCVILPRAHWNNALLPRGQGDFVTEEDWEEQVKKGRDLLRQCVAQLQDSQHFQSCIQTPEMPNLPNFSNFRVSGYADDTNYVYEYLKDPQSEFTDEAYTNLTVTR